MGLGKNLNRTHSFLGFFDISVSFIALIYFFILASTELRKAQSAELYRSICASSTTGSRTSAENLDFAFHLENEVTKFDNK